MLAGITAISFGLELVLFTFIEIPVQNEWKLSSVEYGLVPSTTGVTNVIGGFFYSFLSDSFGRVWPYALAVFHLGIVGLASAFSPNFAVFVILRDITSFALPGVSSLLYATFVEFLPVRNRGKVIVLVLVVQAIGACLTGGLAWWLMPRYTERGWRYLIVATTIPQLFCAAFRLFIFPLQSPRFLIAKGRFKEARRVLGIMARLNGKKLDDILPKGTRLDAEYEAKFNSVKERKRPVCSQFWRNLASIFKPPYLKMTVLISAIYVTSSTAYYCSSIFLLQMLKEYGTDPYFTSFTGYLGQIPGILLMSIIVEWQGIGRINSLRFFTVITIISFILLAFIRNQIATSVLTVFLYFGMVPQISLLYTYMSEIYPTSIRSTAIVFNNNLAASIVIGVPYFSGYLSQVNIPWVYPTVWAGFYLFQFFVSLFLRRETLGQNLHDTA